MSVYPALNTGGTTTSGGHVYAQTCMGCCLDCERRDGCSCSFPFSTCHETGFPSSSRIGGCDLLPVLIRMYCTGLLYSPWTLRQAFHLFGLAPLGRKVVWYEERYCSAASLFFFFFFFFFFFLFFFFFYFFFNFIEDKVQGRRGGEGN